MVEWREAALADFISAAGCEDPSEPCGTPVVQLSEHAVDLTVGDSVRLALLPILPPGYAPSAEWTSSDPMRTTVAKLGVMGATVRGIRPGEAVITAFGGGKSDSALVTVASSPNGQEP